MVPIDSLPGAVRPVYRHDFVDTVGCPEALFAVDLEFSNNLTGLLVSVGWRVGWPRALRIAKWVKP